MGTLNDSSMTARQVAQCQRRVMGTPAYFARRGEPASPAELVNHDAIIYGQYAGDGIWVFQKDGTGVSVAVSGRVRVSAAEGVRAAVLADMGLTIAPEWSFAPELASARVKAVLTEWRLPPITLWALYPTGRMASAKARAFVAFVESVLPASVR